MSRLWMMVLATLLMNAAAVPRALARPKAVAICSAGERGDLELLGRPLDYGALTTCSAAELRLLRNAIFARHGYRFRSPELRAHFSGFDWYRPSAAATEKLRRGEGLSAVERANIKRIKRAERGDAPDWMKPPDMTGKRLVHSYASSQDVYHLCPGGRVVVEFSISEIQNHRQHGSWRLRGGDLELHLVRETGGKPKGKPLHCASVCTYAEYEPFEKKIDRHQTIELQQLAEPFWEIKPDAACP
jgi:hypothetical protein